MVGTIRTTESNGFFCCFISKGVLTVRKVLDRENSDMTLDAQERGVFSLDITATDQALSSNERKSSTVRVRLCLCFNAGLFVCFFFSQTLVFILSRSQAKVLTVAGDLRNPRRKGEA